MHTHTVAADALAEVPHGGFTHLRDALSRFAREKPESVGPIVTCALSVCGPINDGRAICLTESMGVGGWALEEADLAASLGLGGSGRLRLLNGFVAVGLAVGEVDWRDAPEERIRPANGRHRALCRVLGLAHAASCAACSTEDHREAERAERHRRRGWLDSYTCVMDGQRLLF